MESLRKKEDFDKVFKKPEYKVTVPGLYLLARKNQMEHSRLGMAVAKNIIKRANRRNALKRRLRAAFKLRMNDAEQPHLDSVVIAVSPVNEFDERRMTQTADKLFDLLRQKSLRDSNK